MYVDNIRFSIGYFDYSYSQNSSIPNNTLLFNDPAFSNFSNVTTSLYPDRIQFVIKNDTSDDSKKEQRMPL